MNNMGKIFILIFFSLYHISSYAFTLNATLSGDKVTLINGVNEGANKYTLSDWEPQSDLIPTTQWSPGFNYTGAKLILSGPGGSVPLDVHVIGMEYNTGAVSATTSAPSLGFVSICDSDLFYSNVVHLENSTVGECTSSYHLENGTSVMPFYFLRPVIYLNPETIATSFQSLENKEEGYYFGTVSVPLRYWYRSIGDVVTYRNINRTFSMKVYYKPSELTDINIVNPVSGIGVLAPTLDSGGDSISASTTFQILAKGRFVNGLVVDLDKNNVYKLKTEDGNYDIPFSVTCEACDDPILVDNGVNKVDNSFISQPNSTQIPFSLKVHYDGIKKDTIRIGEYSGSFTIMFGADI